MGRWDVGMLGRRAALGGVKRPSERAAPAAAAQRPASHPRPARKRAGAHRLKEGTHCRAVASQAGPRSM